MKILKDNGGSMPNPSTIAEQDCADPMLITHLENEIVALKAQLRLAMYRVDVNEAENNRLLELIKSKNEVHAHVCLYVDKLIAENEMLVRDNEALSRSSR